MGRRLLLAPATASHPPLPLVHHHQMRTVLVWQALHYQSSQLCSWFNTITTTRIFLFRIISMKQSVLTLVRNREYHVVRSLGWHDAIYVEINLVQKVRVHAAWASNICHHRF